MTDEQKKAISIITDLRGKNTITEEDFFLLLEFIIQEKLVYQPYYYPTTPITPMYGYEPLPNELFRVSDNNDNIK